MISDQYIVLIESSNRLVPGKYVCACIYVHMIHIAHITYDIVISHMYHMYVCNCTVSKCNE